MHRCTAALAAFALVLGGCASPRSSPASTPSVGWPVTVTAANGPVAIAARPVRILSLSASATQMLYAIGAGPQVVAVDKYSIDPPQAPRTSMTGYEDSAESYLTVKPDLVILASDAGGTLEAQLKALHVTTMLLPPATTLGDTYAQMRQLGAATGHTLAAGAAVAAVRARIAKIVATVGDRAKGLTYYQELDNTLYTATSHTFIGELFGRLGMVNVADLAGKSSDYPQLSAEYLIQANPQYVFLADTVCCAQNAATFGARPGFDTLRAVRDGHVFPVTDSLASEWGPRVADFLATIADDIAPGSVTPTASPLGGLP
ncbi:MAG TPA: ABC transporter substrate-binding protein [Actinomycetota bacterium]|nr:ABC transporter substrate-binding protein [Actinomycetota bacterium]